MEIAIGWLLKHDTIWEALAIKTEVLEDYLNIYKCM